MTIARAVGQNTLHTAVARVAVLGAWFAVTPRVLAVLGPDRFGFWSLLLVLGGSLAAVDLGLGVAVTRTVARAWSNGHGRQLVALLARAGALQLAVASVLGLGIVLASPLLLSSFHVPAAWAGEARVALALATAAFIVGSISNLFFAALQGIQRMDRALVVALPAATGLAAGILWAMGRPNPLLALTQVQLAYNVVTALGFGVALLRVRPPPTGIEEVGGAGASFREMLVLGGWVQLNGLFGLVQANVDKVLLGALVALAPVAGYELGARITYAAFLPAVLFLGALLPAFSRESSAGEPARLVPLYRAALDPAFAMSFAVTGALIALAPWLLRAWLGTPPDNGAFFLGMLALTQLGNLLTGVSSTVARAGGVAHLETRFAVLGTGLHIGLALVGLQLFGVRGLLLGTVIGSLAAAVWFILRIETFLGIARSRAALVAMRPYLGAAGLAGVAGFLVASLLSPVSAHTSAWPGLVGGGVSYALLFGLYLRAAHRQLWGGLLARAGRLGSQG